MDREKTVKNFLKYFIPERLNIDDGFIITSDDFISTQCDIIIYDKSSTPLIEGENSQNFFTQETVVAIGEVKSNLNKCNLGKALNKLDFDLDNIISDIDSLYDSDINYKDRHNMSLSLNDGIILYSDGHKYLSFPKFENNLNNIFNHISDSNDNNHIKAFAHCLYMITSSSTIYYLDLMLYMT